MNMVCPYWGLRFSVCPLNAFLQHLSSYLGFSYLGRGVSLHGCSSKVQPLLLTLDEGYLLTAALPDLQRRIAPLGPPASAQSGLLGRGVGPPGRCPSLWRGVGLLATAPDLGRGVAPLSLTPWPRTQGSSSQLFLRLCSLALSATAPDLGCGVTPLGCRPSGMGSSRLLPLTSDMG